MSDRPGVILSLVERSWHPARVFSLDVEREGLTVVHLVKGWLRPAWRGLIAPRPSVRVHSAPRKVFWPLVGAWTIGLLCLGRLRAVLVDNEKTAAKLRWWPRWSGAALLMVRAHQDGYELWERGRRIEPPSWAAV